MLPSSETGTQRTTPLQVTITDSQQTVEFDTIPVAVDPHASKYGEQVKKKLSKQSIQE
jgi:hypothetical protein